MEGSLPKNQRDICEFLKTAKTAEDFFVVQILSSNLFYSKTETDIKKMLAERDNYYILAVDNVFSNPNFIDAVAKVLEQYRAFQKNFDHSQTVKFFDAFAEVEVRNKKLIFAALVTSLTLFATVLPSLSQENIIYLAKKLHRYIKKIDDNLNHRYSLSEIFIVLSGVFNKRFYSKLTRNLRIENREHCYKGQKISSYLASLAVKLAFRHARLNNLFKAIEREKLTKGKFSTYSISRIGCFLKGEVESESKSKKELDVLTGDANFFSVFAKPFKNDKNEEDVFNLIGITLREFKQQNSFEGDLTTTISRESALLAELKSYAEKSFRAFSGKIEGDNYEWSNKVYINCCKLLGALSALSCAVDKGWLIDASVKEFVDWTSSIHQVLNKYDIEDEWDKISKYLEQETNKIEWKSNFFTPTQMKQDDPDFARVSRQIFNGIIKTIVGMMNSDGGTLLIGLVERLEDIMEKRVRDSLLKKNEKFFLNVSEELLEAKLDLDSLKRKIQDRLKAETLTSIDNFNNLLRIQQVNIKSSDGTREVFVYKIEVEKAAKLIFSVKTEGESADNRVDVNKTENIWISLLKRADARTIYVDPRKYLTL